MRCDVTLGTSQPPPGESAKGWYFGNGAIWVSLWPDNVVRARWSDLEVDGSIGVNFGFYRSAHGSLSVSGRRLDSPAPAARAYIPSGYGDSGFQTTRIFFSAAGCWEVTATVGGESLTFVTAILAPEPTPSSIARGTSA
jgi:hypothetical protein